MSLFSLTQISLKSAILLIFFFFFFQAEDGIRDYKVTGVQTCALPILAPALEPARPAGAAVVQVLGGDDPAPGPGATAHRPDQRAAPGAAIHDGDGARDHLRADVRDRSAGARDRRPVPAVRDRVSGPDPHVVRRAGLHDGDDRAARRRDLRAVAGRVPVRAIRLPGTAGGGGRDRK